MVNALSQKTQVEQLVSVAIDLTMSAHTRSRSDRKFVSRERRALASDLTVNAERQKLRIR